MHNSPIRNNTLLQEAYQKGYRQGLYEVDMTGVDTGAGVIDTGGTDGDSESTWVWNPFAGGIGWAAPDLGGRLVGPRKPDFFEEILKKYREYYPEH